MRQMIRATQDVLDYYTEQTPYSTAGELVRQYDELPDDIPSLCLAVQNLLLHMFWIGPEAYGITHNQLKDAGRRLCVEFSYESVEERLRNILELDDRPLIEPRDPMRRSVGCCRDYALVLTSILRHKGIPARVRTGVATYLIPDSSRAEDHYVTEYWNPDAKEWWKADPQIDDFQRGAMNIDFDTARLRPHHFLTGWQLVDALRKGEIEPGDVGFPPTNVGPTYGRNKLFADFVGITGHELPVHAWWGLGVPEHVEPEDDELVDYMIELLQGIDANQPTALREALELTATHRRLRKPAGYKTPTYKSPLC